MNCKRKFLTRILPDNLHCYPSAQIKLAFTAYNPDIRLKQVDHRYFMTVTNKDQKNSELFETPIDENQFKLLWEKKISVPIEKTRYFIPLPGALSAELDIYPPPFNHLILTIVTFSSPLQSQKFHAPPWIGKDVTQEGAYKSSNLAFKLQKLLEKDL